jgi:hypothetical protein
MAGEGNKPGGVYERLASPDSFTGAPCHSSCL